MPDDCRYVIISPVKDEGEFIEKTLKSVAAQTVQPLLWVIVDDGSCDRTPEMASEYAAAHPWIRVYRLPRGRARQPGSAVINAFNAGRGFIEDLQFDFIVKLDGDVNLPSTYFETVLSKFTADPRLGIASGVYAELNGRRWLEIPMPHYHAAGASKVIRVACFEQIGGFISARGWDTVDEIRAQAQGWKTAHFREITFEHLKPEGSGIGSLRTNFMHGEIFYMTGGGGLFFWLKVLHRAWRGRPVVAGAVAMVFGFTMSWMRNRRRLVSDAEARYYRVMLNRRILRALSGSRDSTSGQTAARGDS